MAYWEVRVVGDKAIEDDTSSEVMESTDVLEGRRTRKDVRGASE